MSRPPARLPSGSCADKASTDKGAELKRIIAMLLAAAMLGVPETFPEDSSPDADITEETETEEFVFIDTKKIDQEIKEIINKSGAKEENISIAVEFTATGETYYYNDYTNY